MADPVDQFSPFAASHDPVIAPQGTDKLERLEWLISLMLDDALSEAQWKELEGMLEHDQAARECYVQHVQTHADLVQLFGQDDSSPATP